GRSRSLPFRLGPCAPSGSRRAPDPWVAAVRAERDRPGDRRACHEEQRTDCGTASSHRTWRLWADAIPDRSEEPIGAVHGRVRAPGTRPQPVEALQVDVVREDAGPLRGEQQRLSPGPRAQVEHGFARLRLHQMAQELAALVLRLEQTFAPRAGAEEVRPRRPDEQGVGSARRWRGLDPFVEKVRRELLAGAEQTIGAQADGAGDGN